MILKEFSGSSKLNKNAKDSNPKSKKNSPNKARDSDVGFNMGRALLADCGVIVLGAINNGTISTWKRKSPSFQLGLLNLPKISTKIIVVFLKLSFVLPLWCTNSSLYYLFRHNRLPDFSKTIMSSLTNSKDQGLVCSGIEGIPLKCESLVLLMTTSSSNLRRVHC